MNDFVDQCRREWKRLGVHDSIADEMAAELAADLTEAKADGVSARALLGNAATDPRSFAASWADERAVIPLSSSTARLPGRSLILAAIAALTIITAVGAGLVLLASPQASAPQAASDVLLAAPPEPTSIRVVAPPPISPDGSGRVWITSDGLVTVTPIEWLGRRDPHRRLDPADRRHRRSHRLAAPPVLVVANQEQLVRPRHTRRRRSARACLATGLQRRQPQSSSRSSLISPALVGRKPHAAT